MKLTLLTLLGVASIASAATTTLRIGALEFGATSGNQGGILPNSTYDVTVMDGSSSATVRFTLSTTGGSASQTQASPALLSANNLPNSNYFGVNGGAADARTDLVNTGETLTLSVAILSDPNSIISSPGGSLGITGGRVTSGGFGSARLIGGGETLSWSGANTDELFSNLNGVSSATFSEGQNFSGNFIAQISTVPEPTSAALLGLGGLALVARRRR